MEESGTHGSSLSCKLCLVKMGVKAFHSVIEGEFMVKLKLYVCSDLIENV